MDPKDLYCKGTRVWFPDKEKVWVGATLTQDLKDDKLSIEYADGKTLDINVSSSSKILPPLRNPEVLVGANDLTTLSHLHEPAVLHNLSVRFISYGAIYTYCGIVLVAINPYTDLSIYGPEIISAYNGQQMGEMDPHIFAVAEDAYSKMIDEGINQSIIVSGESGAGKTVNAKFAMRFFANVGGSATETAIERKVLASNPIMEAIGNAKTIRNDNSSRFGKYIEIDFDSNQSIIGAHMRTYLLEKSRVVFQAENERGYHIFYQMCACHTSEELKELGLGPPENFFYIDQGGNALIDGVDDESDFAETKAAMALLGIYSETQRMVFRILAAILHLGNVKLLGNPRREEECHVSDDDVSLHMVAILLGVDKKQLQKWLCNRKIVATGDVYVKPLSLHEANVGRDALSKHIYSQIFKWIVEHINASLSTSTQRQSFIGVLDIYGFETFEVNSFEQFCINYANEKLQQQFNMHVFKLEQEEYTREDIIWSFIDFYDNQPCIDLIEAKLGLLDLLDEECRMPKGSDESWARKLYKQHLKTSQHFEKPRMSEQAFVICHYADNVTYECDGFVEKNRDTINPEHLALLRASEYELVGELFTSTDLSAMFSPRKRASSRVGKNAPTSKKTVGSEFRDSLRQLMETLNSTSPHYVRCIKPNDSKSAMKIEPTRFVQQLRACGVLETIRISAAGFPSRWIYEEFVERYGMLLPQSKSHKTDIRGTCQKLLDIHIKDEDKFQLGKTKIFFRAGQVAFLEKLRSDKLRTSCVIIQKRIRGWMVRKQYLQKRNAAIVIQSWVRGYQARCLAKFIRQTYAAIILQSVWRGWYQKNIYLRQRNAAIIIQSYTRGRNARLIKLSLLRERKTIFIQKCYRGYVARRHYGVIRKAIILLQCCVRRMSAKKELKQLKVEARSVEHYKTVTKGMENKIISLQQKLNSEVKERKDLQEKTKTLDALTADMAAVSHLRPKCDALEKQTKTLEEEVKELHEKLIEVRTNEENVKQTTKEEINHKDEELITKSKEIEELKSRIGESKDTQQKMELEFEARLAAALNDQKNDMLSEFSSERASHQKMLREYTRLEQRFANLEDELAIERSPEKGKERLNSRGSDRGTSLDYNSLPDDTTSDIIRSLREELAVERSTKDDLVKSQSDTQIQTNQSKMDELIKCRNRLDNENASLRKELKILKTIVNKDESNTDEDNDKAMSNLLEQIDELRLEADNLHLKLDNALHEKQMINGDDEIDALRSANRILKKEIDELRQDKKINNNIIDRLGVSQANPDVKINDLSESAQDDLNRITNENLELRDKLEGYETELKKLREHQLLISSPPRQRSMSKKVEGAMLLPADQETSRRRAMSAGVKYSEDLTAGKLVMTYAGLFRKNELGDQKGKDDKASTSSLDTDSNIPLKKAGMLQFTLEKETLLLHRLVLDLKPSDVENDVPGLPAHLIFMAIRYADKLNDERMMQSFLTNVFSGIKKTIKEHAGDLDFQSFWLSNSRRLSHDMKQYSGEKMFQSHNSAEQSQHSLVNFDLTEYRSVLTDLSVCIYQEMVKTIQDRIGPLIVAGMLEYESIPGVSSSKPFSRKKNRAKSSASIIEDIVTVKDITNKLSAILAVLNAHCIETDLIKQIFKQIFYFLNVTMLNNLLLRKDMCHWSRGMQVRFNITQLEEWCRTNQLDQITLVNVLESTIQATQLLQVNKKSLEDVDAICAVGTALNTLQMQKILSMYTPANEYEPRVPSSVIRAVVARGDTSDPKSLMGDVQYIYPVSFPFTPSSFVFESAIIPPALHVDGISII